MPETPIYDDERIKPEHDVADERLRQITGITPDKEATMDRKAHTGADEDVSERLKDAEGGGEGPIASKAESQESSELGSSKDQGSAEQSPFGYHEEQGRTSRLLPGRSGKSKPSARKKRKRMLLIGGLFGGVLIPIILIMLFLSSLKAVHFSTVLRSVGFARFQLYMRERFAQTAFDAATLTEDSTGSFKLEDRSLFDRLRGVNPEKQLAELGREDTLKFIFSSESKWGGLKTINNFEGVRINGQEITLNEISQRLSGRNYNDLKLSDIIIKLKVKAEFTNRAKDGLAEPLAEEGRAFRASVYDGLRQASDTRMWGWLNEAREYVAKKFDEAFKKDVIETNQYDEFGTTPKSAYDQVNEDAKNQHDDTLQQAEDPANNGTEKTKSSKLAEEASLKATLSFIVAATTMGCIAHDVNQSFKDAAMQKEQRVARTGHDALSKADQIKRGEVVGEAVGAENTRWNGAEDSVLYKQATGQTVTQEDQKQLNDVPSVLPVSSAIASVANIADGIFNSLTGGQLADLASSIPFFGPIISAGRDEIINDACSILLNQYFQSAVVIASILTPFFKESEGAIQAALETTLAAAKTYGIGALVGVFIQQAVDAYAGTDFSGTERGANLYNTDAVATDYLQQTGTRKISYGRPLSPQEANDSQQLAMETLHAEYNQKSFSERYFAANNPFSLVGKLAAVVPNNTAGFTASIRSFFSSLFTNSFTAIQQLFSTVFLPHKAALAAAGTGDYGGHGVDEWGWSNDELQRLQTDPAFQPKPLADFVEAHYADLKAKYEPCFTYVLQVDKPDQCKPTIDGDDNKDYVHLESDEALKWRAYMSEVYAADELTKDLNAQGAP
jgi:hypothetical protein